MDGASSKAAGPVSRLHRAIELRAYSLADYDADRHCDSTARSLSHVRSSWPSSRTRELVIQKTPFIAAHTVQKTRIVILAVYHGAQQWPQVL
jgi:plasmid stabilization system protein ParE